VDRSERPAGCENRWVNKTFLQYQDQDQDRGSQDQDIMFQNEDQDRGSQDQEQDHSRKVGYTCILPTKSGTVPFQRN